LTPCATKNHSRTPATKAQPLDVLEEVLEIVTIGNAGHLTASTVSFGANYKF